MRTRAGRVPCDWQPRRQSRKPISRSLQRDEEKRTTTERSRLDWGSVQVPAKTTVVAVPLKFRLQSGRGFPRPHRPLERGCPAENNSRRASQTTQPLPRPRTRSPRPFRQPPSNFASPRNTPEMERRIISARTPRHKSLRSMPIASAEENRKRASARKTGKYSIGLKESWIAAFHIRQTVSARYARSGNS